MSVTGSITQKSLYNTPTVSPLSTACIPPTSNTVFQPQITSNLPDTIINYSSGNYSNNGTTVNLLASRNLTMQSIDCSTTSTAGTMFRLGKFE